MPNAAVTIRKPVDEVKSSWGEHFDDDVEVSFAEAPRDQGTEVRVPVGSDDSELEIKIALRRFKQVVETGEVVKSDGSPDGVSKERLANQEVAQPPEEVPA